MVVVISPETSPRLSRWTLFVAALTALGLVFSMIYWGDPLSIQLTRDTLLYAAAVVLLTIPPAVLTALLLFRTNIIGYRWLTSLLVVWLFIPVYVHIAGWRDLFGPQGWWEIASVIDPSSNLIDGWTGLLWLHSLAVFPWVTLLTGLAFMRSSSVLEEDARLDVSSLWVLAKVTLRGNWDIVLVAAAWIVVSVFGEMSIASVCNVRTYAEVVFTGIPLGQSTSETALSFVPGVLLVIGLILLAAWIATFIRPRSSEIESQRLQRLPLGSLRGPATLLVWGLFGMAFLPPMAGLIYKVGITIDQVDGQFVRGWSLPKVFQLSLGSLVVYREELLWTLALSSTAAIATLVVALLLSDIARRSRLGGFSVAMLCAALFAIPGPLVGIGIAWGVNRPWLVSLAPLIDRTIFAPTLAILTVTIPLVTFFYWHAMKVSPQLYEMAKLDGSSWWRTWIRIVIPGNLSLILSGGLIAFVLAANDVARSVMVLPAGIDTISRRIFGLLHFGGEDNVAGILLMNLGVVAVLSLAIQKLADWRSRNDFHDSLP